MRKIKVLHIITKLELGGAQRNTLYTVKHLDRSRFEVALAAGRGGILDDEAAAIEGARFIVASDLVRQVNPLRDFLALIGLAAIIRREKPDIVHTHSSKAGILGRFAAGLYNTLSIFTRRQRIKVIHTFHGFGFTPAQPKIVRAVFTTLEKLAASVSDSLVFVSSANMKEAAAKGIGDARKYILIRSGVDTEFFRNFILSDEERLRARRASGAEDGEKIVATIAPFKKQKNLSDFIKAVSILKKRGVAIRAVVAGDGEERARLESLARALNVESDVFFAGWLESKEKIAALLKISSAFLMTSLWEGLPRSLVEAVSAGVPVCANAVDGVTDIVRDGESGLLSAPGDVRQAADNVEKILADEHLARRLAERAAERLDETFDIKKMVAAQEQLYVSLLSARRFDKRKYIQ